MENSILNQENFEATKSFLNQINNFALKNNENLQLTNQNIQGVSNLLNKAGEIFIESKKIDNENQKLKNELALIVSDFKIKQGYLHAIFNERSRIIDKHFEIINKGIRENNDELILKGLRGASEFVSTNPLNNFDVFKNILLDKNSPLELDF